MYDIVIIGAGVSGSAAARELSRYEASICVLEKAEDVCCGTTKANSAIVHAGFDAANGSLMAKLNVQGNQMMEQLISQMKKEQKVTEQLKAENQMLTEQVDILPACLVEMSEIVYA